MNYPPKLDYNLKKSFISDPYQVQHQHLSQSRGNLSKRSSFTLTHEYNSSPLNTELPKTPKTGSINNVNSIPFSMDQFQVATQYYHQGTYPNQIMNQHQVQHAQYAVQQHNQYFSQPQNSVPVQMNALPVYTNRPQSSINKLDLSTSRAEQQYHQKIEAFNLEQKKQSDTNLEQQIKQLSEKLEKTIQRVASQEEIISKKPWESSSPSIQGITKLINESILQNLKLREIQKNMQTNLIKREIQEIRKQIDDRKWKTENLSIEVNNKIQRINQNLSKSIETVNGSLNTLVGNMVEMENRKKAIEMERFKIQMERQIQLLQRNIDQKIKRDKQEYQKLTNSSSCEALPSRKVFIGDPILVKFVTKVSVNTKSIYKQIEEQQTVYKVDNDGYLLDAEGHYIVNSKYEQIKLSAQQIDIIKNMGLLR